MRRSRNTAVQSCLFASVLVHAGALVAVWLARPGPKLSQAGPLEVYSVSEQELQEMGAALPEFDRADPLPNTDRELTPEQVAALPRDAEKLPRHEPSDKAVDSARGQIVELADPRQAQEAPEDAAYLSRADHRVEEETASRRFKINSEVIAPSYEEKSSRDHGEDGDAKARLEGDSNLERGALGSPDGATLASLPKKAREGSASARAAAAALSPAASLSRPPPVEETGTGASPNPRKDRIYSEKENELESEIRLEAPLAARLDPKLRALSPDIGRTRLLTSRPHEGEDDGTTRAIALFPRRLRYGDGGGGGDDGSSPVQLQKVSLSGAPTTDRIREKPGQATMLNAQEFKYFAYMQKIKRQVNFYWSQAIENVTSVRERLTRNEYTTVLNVVLDREGNLRSVSLVRTCGIKSFDEATLQAFRIAAPFPPPPDGLVDASGQVVLPTFEFTVTISRGTTRYSAVDPRANVLFPGIVWPR